MSPAVVVSQSSPSSSKSASKSTHRSESAKAQPRTHKSRVVKRRARARRAVESDEEIERETLSDVSDSDDDLTPSDSASDSEAESEPESLVMHNGRHHSDTPSTTQSPPPGEVEALSVKSELGVVSASHPSHSAPAFFKAGDDWSDMVTAEGANDATSLPVIEFSELATGDPPHLTKQDGEEGANGREDDAGSRHGSERAQRGEGASTRGGRGRAARLAYQQRLETDPSFVPTVGEFWGHDDRLLQKDLRSLSGWWRGRWQGRGGGRGGWGMRGRGRGGYFEESGWYGAPEDQQHDVPAVDKAWTHDGFEELRAKEEQRRAAKRAVKVKGGQAGNVNGTSNTPVRGGAPRGRGRGSFQPAASPTPSRMSYIQRLRSQPDRPWFAMKPEHVWTKQFEGFLFSDPSLKPKHGKPASYRVHLPGKSTEIVRAPAPEKHLEDASELRSQPPSEMNAFTDVGSRAIVVKMPKASFEKEVAQRDRVSPPEPITTVEDSSVEPPTGLAMEFPSIQQFETPARPLESERGSAPAQSPVRDDVTATPALTRDNSLSEKSFTDLNGVAEEGGSLESRQPSEIVAAPMPPPPIQTSFPPPLQPTPSYSPAPYGYPALPPGVALNQQGFAYEVASGRPVYLHSTPPPQIPVYNPRPIPFMPGHMHHHSLSGDFMQGPSTPPINGFVDPMTGQPFFQLPRQSSSRIEIRAPDDTSDGQARGKRDHRPSNLRSVTNAEQNGEANGGQQASPYAGSYGGYLPVPEYYQAGMMSGAPQPTYQPSEGAGSMSPGSEVPPQSHQPSMMGYPAYQQQYYYPEQYYPYVEMPQQPVQYDPYNTDPRQQPPVYY